ncbi:hypothetical protein RP300_01121 [Oligella urethralis]|uniref:uroporphyrinogen-III synthase n=1 Tax=Oligella urethralis TaxID=90245 RepID=UPI0029587E81|nr:uroporphyrinogen-III synthase [Oligella urethralis]WOS37569.1 hypothetical protein RP300_01121 [Oligella urethralis]
MSFDLVINTRPAHKSRELEALLGDFKQLNLPALSLVPLDFQLPATWQANDFIFFVSQFAVDCFFSYLQQHAIGWPPHLYAAAVGPVSADALLAHGLVTERVLVAPQGEADSESFLDWFEAHYQVPKRVMIVRAEHGRDWLYQQLQQRHVETSFLAVYKRTAAVWSEQAKQPLLDLLSTKPEARVCWLMTSRDSVDAVVAQWQQEPLLAQYAWQHDFLFFHARIADHLQHKKMQLAPAQKTPLRVHFCQADNVSIVAALKRLSAKGSYVE